jgi:hypothetical protein
MLFLGLAFIIFLCVCIAAFFANDLYIKGISKLTCIEPLQDFGKHMIHGDIYISNVLCAETQESFLQMVTFYKKKGWFCDAGVSCYFGQSFDLGSFAVNIWKRSSYSHSNPATILFYEEYDIGYKGPYP